MSVLTVKKNRHKPVRYEIYLDHKLVFTVSPTTLRDYTAYADIKALRKGSERVLNLPLSELAAAEQHFLMQEACFYLSKGERSPYHLRMWCSKRNIPDDWTTPILTSCREKDFLNPERFIIAFVANRKLQANKPWTRVHYELKCHEIDETLIEKYAYDDLEILKQVYVPRSPRKKIAALFQALASDNAHSSLSTLSAISALRTLEAQLLRQGFAYHTVQRLTTHLKTEFSNPSLT